MAAEARAYDVELRVARRLGARVAYAFAAAYEAAPEGERVAVITRGSWGSIRTAEGRGRAGGELPRAVLGGAAVAAARATVLPMNAVRGRVRGGHIELDGALPEGAEVVVLHGGDEDAFELDDARMAKLETRMAAAEQGDVEPAVAVLARLRAAT